MNYTKSGGNIRNRKHKQLWYKDGLRFECQRSGNCCRGEPGVVWVSKKEVKNISKSMGISPELFAKKHLRLINGRISLLEYENGDCVMYDNGCKVYETRPQQCRTFPFWSSNLKTKAEWEEQKKMCPGIGKGKLYTLDEIENSMSPELNDL
jgi:Fe-S-cluster containining protein